MKVAVYPGTFDPITNGHIDLVGRSLRLFDKLIIAVAENPRKKPLFTLAERTAMIKDVFKDQPQVSVDSFKGLTADYARSVKANVILRGLRALTDFEYEFQMALTNRELDAEAETVFLMTSKDYAYLNSSIVREVGLFGGDVAKLVPPVVVRYLKKKLNTNKR